MTNNNTNNYYYIINENQYISLIQDMHKYILLNNLNQQNSLDINKMRIQLHNKINIDDLKITINKSFYNADLFVLKININCKYSLPDWFENYLIENHIEKNKNIHFDHSNSNKTLTKTKVYNHLVKKHMH